MTNSAKPRANALPTDAAAERAVASVLALNPEYYDEVIELVSEHDFQDRAALALFRVVANLESAGKPCTPITVYDEAKRLKCIADVGDRAGIDEAFEKASGFVSDLSAYVDIVVEKSRLRKAISVGRAICDAAAKSDADAVTVTELAETSIFELGAKSRTSSMTPMVKAVPEILAQISSGKDALLAGATTGLEDLDKMTGGLQPGQLWIVAARPGVGKSALALQMARSVAESTGKAVPFLSYEMSVSELGIRMLASALACSVTMLRDGDLPAGLERELSVEAQKMAQLPLYIDDNPPSTISGVRSQMRRLARRNEIGAIFVDYLQLMESDRRNNANRNDEVSDITRGLKKLAAELGVPVIALSQLNRNVELRGGAKRPQLSDLRDSGAVEQDANVIMFVYRESMVNQQADPRLAELIIGKQRSGPCGSVYTNFDGASTKFSTTTQRPQSAGMMQAGGGDSPF